MNLWRFFRAHPGLVNLLVFLALCGVGSGWLAEHDHRVLEQAKAKADVASWEALWVQASNRVQHDGTTVTQTVTKYRTLHDTVVAEIERAHSDGYVPHLPAFVRASDSVVAACTEYQTSCEEYRRTSDSLVAALRRVIAVHEPRTPRWSLSGAALYDPIRQVPALDAEAGLRVVAGFSLVARAEDRLGESPRLYVGVRRVF